MCAASASSAVSAQSEPPQQVTVEHWYDFMCPFCYIAQNRNEVLREQGIVVVEHGLQVHPEIGAGGAPAGPRVGPSYDLLAREAAAAGLPLEWSDRMPYSRPALAAAEWIGHAHPGSRDGFAESVFAAYFGEQRDIESLDLLADLAEKAGADPDRLRLAVTSGEAFELLDRSEALARRYAVDSTPTWIAGGRRVSGLREREWFADWAESLSGKKRVRGSYGTDRPQRTVR
jgi:predicted DsbA family dithiol-disulfide isomerase